MGHVNYGKMFSNGSVYTQREKEIQEKEVLDVIGDMVRQERDGNR